MNIKFIKVKNVYLKYMNIKYFNKYIYIGGGGAYT